MSTDGAQARPVLEIYLDLVCPWCRIGEHRVRTALAKLAERHGEAAVPRVVYRPFQLQPTLPEGGVPRREHFVQAFGDAGRVDRAFGHVADVGAAEGVTFRMDRMDTEPNSLLAHVLLEWAQEQDRGPEVAQALFDAFFVSGRDIGDAAVLRAVAARVGLDERAAAAELDDPAARARVRSEVDRARRAGVTAVPTYVVAGTAAAGALTPDQLLELLASPA